MGVIIYNQTPFQSSTLNPNAPIFVPMKSYLTVEDFSDEWWDLVHSSPFFRDYWLTDCFTDEISQNYDFNLPDLDAFFVQEEEKEVDDKSEKEMITLGALKYNRSAQIEPPRSFQKVPKIVKNVRVNPRTIHQPR